MVLTKRSYPSGLEPSANHSKTKKHLQQDLPPEKPLLRRCLFWKAQGWTPKKKVVGTPYLQALEKHGKTFQNPIQLGTIIN